MDKADAQGRADPEPETPTDMADAQDRFESELDTQVFLSVR